jgi:hypothetical protein
MVRLFVPICVSLAVLIGLTDSAPAKQPAKPPNKPEKNSYLTDKSLIQRGYDMLKDRNLTISPTIDFWPNFQAVFAPRVGLVNVDIKNVSFNLGSLSKEHQVVTEQLARETNDLLKAQLGLQKQQLEVLIEQTKLQVAQKQLGEAAFEYTKKRDEPLLRRLDYTIPANKLVVIVADFSCGGSGEGAEIADEIASALYELKQKSGIDIEIMAGEVRADRVIRSERMAQDIGQHFPKGTCYAVVWGTLSPRTVGKFRPHITCVFKVDDERGVSRSYTIDPESQQLPLGATAEEQRRDQHTQLVAFTCAVIPGCYASYAIAREERPNLDTFYTYLEKGSPEIVKQYKAELAPLTRWIDHRERLATMQPPCKLRRVTTVSKEWIFPRLVTNTKDNSLMTLVTERDKDGKERPRRFKDKGGEYLVYIDVAETTNRQFLLFLNERGNQKEGGVLWINDATNVAHNITQDAETKRWRTGQPQEDLERPTINVSWFGANSYCVWAGKALPTEEEWQTSAESETGGKFPWGDAADNLELRCATNHRVPEVFPTRRVGTFATSDRSRIGCLDMAGNVSEWCADVRGAAQGDRAVCGGNYHDKLPENFVITRSSPQPAASHSDWIGFRGVVRVRVEP